MGTGKAFCNCIRNIDWAIKKETIELIQNIPRNDQDIHRPPFVILKVAILVLMLESRFPVEILTGRTYLAMPS